MSKDYKIGIMIGLVLAIAAVLWVACGASSLPDSDDGLVAANDQFPSESTAGPSDSEKYFDPENTISLEDAISTSNEPEAVENKPMQMRYHIVSKGDTLTAIAKKYYGSSAEYKKILNANSDMIKNKNSLKENMKLYIPE